MLELWEKIKSTKDYEQKILMKELELEFSKRFFNHLKKRNINFLLELQNKFNKDACFSVTGSFILECIFEDFESNDIDIFISGKFDKDLLYTMLQDLNYEIQLPKNDVTPLVSSSLFDYESPTKVFDSTTKKKVFDLFLFEKHGDEQIALDRFDIGCCRNIYSFGNNTLKLYDPDYLFERKTRYSMKTKQERIEKYKNNYKFQFIETIVPYYIEIPNGIKHGEEEQPIKKYKKIDEYECPVCKDRGETFYTLLCGHVFCDDCRKEITDTRNRKYKCPLCRTEQEDLRKIFLV